MADANEVVIAANGAVYAAPAEGASLPESVDDVLGGEWVDVGFISEDGVSFADAKTLDDVGAWQSFYSIRKFLTGKESTLEFVMRQWNADNIEFGFGGGSVDGGGAEREVQAVTLESFGGTDTFKITYNSQESGTAVTRGTNNTAAGIKAVIEGISGVDFTVTVSEVSDGGFLVTFNETGVRTMLSITSGTGSVTGDVVQLQAGAAASGSEATYTPADPSDSLDYRALVVKWNDGDKNYMLVAPRGLVTGDTEIAMARTAASDIPVAYSVIPEGLPEEGDLSTQPWYLVTDDPAFL